MTLKREMSGAAEGSKPTSHRSQGAHCLGHTHRGVTCRGEGREGVLHYLALLDFTPHRCRHSDTVTSLVQNTYSDEQKTFRNSVWLEKLYKQLFSYKKNHYEIMRFHFVSLLKHFLPKLLQITMTKMVHMTIFWTNIITVKIWSGLGKDN